MRLVFMGTPQAAVPSLERLIADGDEIVAVYTQPDRPSGRGNKVAFSPVKDAAIAHGIEVRQPLKIKTDEAFDEFSAFKADAAIVVAYGRILPERWLTAFPNGAINVHFSLLPKYRGAAPVNWAIVNGESETGVTTMRMDAGLDTGDILLQRVTEIGAEETSVELMSRLADVGAELLSETLSKLNEITSTSQDHAAATLAPIMKKEIGMIDWSMPAEAIANRIRGFQPFPSAYSFLQGKRITLWRAEGAAGEPGPPGKVVRAGGGELLIGTGDRLLSISELQLEGKKRMNVRDVLNGGAIREGDILGI